MKLLLKVVLSVLPIIIFVSCMDSPVNNPGKIVFPEKDITYTQHVEPLLRFSCNAPGCHNSMDRKGNIILDTYEQLIMSYGGQMVVAGDPDRSMLIKIILRQVPHSLLVDFRVNNEQIIGLRRWIRNGAPR